jgi:hypothetical protein
VAFPPIAPRRWTHLMTQAACLHPAAPGWWQLYRERLALAILAELYNINPTYLRTTLLPEARLRRRPWSEQRASLIKRLTRQHSREA